MCVVTVDDENRDGIDCHGSEPPQGGYPPCVGGFGGALVLAGTAEQVCTTLRLTRLISACKTGLVWAVLMGNCGCLPDTNVVLPGSTDQSEPLNPSFSLLIQPRPLHLQQFRVTAM